MSLPFLKLRKWLRDIRNIGAIYDSLLTENVALSGDVKQLAADLDSLRTDLELNRSGSSSWRIELDPLKSEVEALKIELGKLNQNIMTDKFSNVPYWPAGILDRNNIGGLILRDAIAKPSYAFGVWLATIQAAKLGTRQLQIFDFGVAYGDGLVNLCEICAMITKSTDINFEIFGFDFDVGMPEISDERDHPEIWHEGQFLSDHDAIRSRLTSNAELISGNIRDTLPEFIKDRIKPECPVGFVSIDVDLYSLTVSCFDILRFSDPNCYLPTTIVYMDDVNDLLTCNSWCGEALAIREFNEAEDLRKLEELRVRQNRPPAGWHDHIYGLHVLNHRARQTKIPGVLFDINITAM